MLFLVFSAYYFIICHATCCSVNLVPSVMEIHCQLTQQMYIGKAKHWMQYSANHIAITAVLLSQNNLRSNLRA